MQLGQHSCCAAQQSLSRPFYAHVSQSSGKVSLYSIVLVFHPRSRYLVAFLPGCYLDFSSWAVSYVTSVRLQILIRTYITASTAGGRFDVENFWWPGDLFHLGCLFLAHWFLVLSRGVGSYCLMQGPGADVGWWRAESYRSTKKRHEFMYWYKTMYSFVGVTFTTYIPLYNWPNETTNKEHKQCP